MHYASYLFENITIKGSRLPNLDFQLCDIILQFTIYEKGRFNIFQNLHVARLSCFGHV